MKIKHCSNVIDPNILLGSFFFPSGRCYICIKVHRNSDCVICDYDDAWYFHLSLFKKVQHCSSFFKIFFFEISRKIYLNFIRTSDAVEVYCWFRRLNIKFFNMIRFDCRNYKSNGEKRLDCKRFNIYPSNFRTNYCFCCRVA